MIEKNFDISLVSKDLSKRFVKDFLYFSKKVLKNKKWAVPLRKLCQIADANSYNSVSRKRLNSLVLSVSAVQPTFTKHSVCAQMYDDSDDDMRWAVKNGALAVIVDHQIDDLPCIVVNSPKDTYARMCHYYRELSGVSVTAVTGSIGKTTVKRMINEVFSSQYKTLCNTVNHNALYHAGYFCQHIPSESQKMVQEVSEDTPGYTQAMSVILSPNVSVITCVDVSHIEAFGSKESIVDEVCGVLAGMPKNGTVVYCMDDFFWPEKLMNRKVVTVSMDNKNADFYAQNVSIGGDGISFMVVNSRTGENYPILLNRIYAIHNVTCALLAFAAGIVEHVSPENIVKGLNGFKMLGMRQNLFMTEGEGNVWVYADCFNAVAKSVKSAIDAVKMIPVSGKKIVVLGDVGELGELSDEVHAEIASYTLQNEWIDAVLVYGEAMIEAFGKISVSSSVTTYYCNTHLEIENYIRAIVKENDLVMFKGSHSCQLRECIGHLWPKNYSKQNHAERDPYNEWIKMLRKS